jgi:hypothetical protein
MKTSGGTTSKEEGQHTHARTHTHTHAHTNTHTRTCTHANTHTEIEIDVRVPSTSDRNDIRPRPVLPPAKNQSDKAGE